MIDKEDAAALERYTREETQQNEREARYQFEAQKMGEAFADAALKSLDSGLNGIMDRIQNGAFGITQAGGDLSSVTDVLGRIERKVPRG